MMLSKDLLIRMWQKDVSFLLGDSTDLGETK